MQIAPLFIALLLTTSVGSESLADPVPPSQPPPTTTTVSEHVILFVLEGVDQQALKTGSMSVLSRLVRDGAATWSAESIAAPRRLPAMASLLWDHTHTERDSRVAEEVFRDTSAGSALPTKGR